MLKELLNGTIRAGLSKFEFSELPVPPDNISLSAQCDDSIKWRADHEFLRIEVTRSVTFEPSCNFTIEATYFVEHYLKDPESLCNLDPKDIKKEIEEDPLFYIQENQGFMARITSLIAQVTASFGNPPMIFPPVFKYRDIKE